MILMRIRHILQVGIASTVLTLGIASAPSAQPAQRPPAGKPAAKPAAAPPAAKPGTPAATAQKPAAAKPASGKPAPAQAAAQSAAPGGASATLLASFGDWQVFSAPAGRSRLCYAISQPKDRLPKNVSRDPAYVFVSFNPAENIRNEVAFRMGFAAKETAPAEVVVGATTYGLLTKATDAWLKNLAEAGPAVTNMAKNQSMILRAQSSRGTQLTDRYSLTGFGPALDRARKECS